MKTSWLTASFACLLIVPAQPASAADAGARLARVASRFELPSDPAAPSASLPKSEDGSGRPAAPIGAAAETSPARPGMTLAELESLALANNPTVQQAAMRVRAARGNCLQVGLYPNPLLGYVGDEIGSLGTSGKQGGFVGQEVVTAGKLQLRRAVASHEVQQAEQALRAQEGRVLTDARIAFYDVLAAQATIDVNQRLVEIGRQAVDAAERLLAAQEVSRVDVLQARIEAESAELELQDARNRHQAAWRGMTAVLGVPEMQPLALVGDLEAQTPDVTWEEALQRILGKSPELAEARAALRRAQCEVARQCAERVPNVDLRASVVHDAVEQEALAGVEFAIPLTIYNRNQGNIYRANAELIAAGKEVQRVELSLQQRLATVYERYANARHQAERYRDLILPNAKTSLDLIQIGYRQGEFDYLKLLTAQRTYSRADLAYVVSLRELQSAHAAIEGLLLGGGLERVGTGANSAGEK